MKALVTIPEGVVFDTFFTKENIRLAESLGEIRYNKLGRKMTADDVISVIGDADVYITGWGSPRLDKAILDAAPNLKLLTHLCGTVVPFISDNVWERGVRVISGNAYFAESVAEGTVAYILAALRNIPYYSSKLKDNGEWKRTEDTNKGLLGRTVGVVSYGTISRILVRMLSPFGVKIKVCDIRPVPYEDLERYNMTETTIEDIFSTCDIITLHTAGVPETRHMIDKRLISMIKDGALLVNTARGMLIDEEALADGLEDGHFSAILDVYEKEPPAPESRLYKLPNVIMMPHMAGPTVDRRQIITHDLLAESAAFIDRGEKLIHEITFEKAKMMSLK